MNQGIPLSWGCRGNALSNQQSIKPCQINQEKEKNSVNQEYPWYFKIFLSECINSQHLPEMTYSSGEVPSPPQKKYMQNQAFTFSWWSILSVPFTSFWDFTFRNIFIPHTQKCQNKYSKQWVHSACSLFN